MDMNKTQTLHGLYGSKISRSKAIGYCYYHKAALTVNTMKCHECLKKQCDSLKKYEDHDYWRQREQKKELKKAHRQNISNYYN